ncbi:MAG: DUF3159 domain-containing protein [Nocardioidaceae bacterium]|nr:DUF3159 domain-containing protein [Nocardioidaceae bacterium]
MSDSEQVWTGGTGPSEPAHDPAHDTVEKVVRAQLAKALGGARGMLEGAVPTIAFTITYLLTREVRTALIVGGSLAAVLLVVRLVQRQNPQFVVNALVGIGIAAVFALRSGDAADAFLPGIIYNAVYAVVLMFSVVVGWPVVGFLVGSVTGDPTAWHQDKPMVKLCGRLTWLLAAPCLVRVVVQLPLYLLARGADDGLWFALLGGSKVVLGWPLQVAAFAAMAWVLGRGRTPVARPAQA